MTGLVLNRIKLNPTMQIRYFITGRKSCVFHSLRKYILNSPVLQN